MGKVEEIVEGWVYLAYCSNNTSWSNKISGWSNKKIAPNKFGNFEFVILECPEVVQMVNQDHRVKHGTSQ